MVRMQVFAQMRDYPVLLCPVASIPAFRHGERSWQVEGKTVKYLDAWSYTEWFNLLGTPAVVVPVGKSPEGLPIGVQIVARPWQEELVISVAAALEEQSAATGIRQCSDGVGRAVLARQLSARPSGRPEAGATSAGRAHLGTGPSWTGSLPDAGDARPPFVVYLFLA